MKRIGILGGVNAESTADYYLTITRDYLNQHADVAYPSILIYSVVFQDFLDWQNHGRWDVTAQRMVEIFHALASASADIGVIATNTLHHVYDEVAEQSPIPRISIVDATAKEVKRLKLQHIGLPGTRFTMEENSYAAGLVKHEIACSVPESPQERLLVHHTIVNELVRGLLVEQSRQAILRIIDALLERGAKRIILGCTELPLLISGTDAHCPSLNTTRIHALSALQSLPSQ